MDGDMSNTTVALRSLVDRIENLHNEREELNQSIREVYGEAKDAGFEVAALREIVRERRMEAEARESRYALLDQYRRELGMLGGTPLGEYAVEREEAAMDRPRPFAEQPLHRRRGRPRKASNVAPYRPSDDPLDAA